jgi:hypothetical protein
LSHLFHPSQDLDPPYGNPIADKPFAKGQRREYLGRRVFTTRKGEPQPIDVWRAWCTSPTCSRSFKVTAFHGHDPEPAPAVCRYCIWLAKLAGRKATVAKTTQPSSANLERRIVLADQRLTAARLAEQDLAKREREVAERERAATIAELERRRVAAKVSAEREREAKRTADAGREAKRAAHVASVFEHLARAIEAAGGGAPFKGPMRAVYTAWLAYKRDGAAFARAKFINYLSDVRERAEWGQRADIDDHLRQAYLAFKELDAIKYEPEPSFQD